MLLVNGFRPLSRDFRNKTDNFQQNKLSFQSQNYTKGLSILEIKKPDENEIITSCLLEYSDVLGESFKGKFLTPFIDILKEHNISIKCSKMKDYCPIDLYGTCYVKEASKVGLINKNGEPILRGGDIVGLNKNHAIFVLCTKLFNNELEMIPKWYENNTEVTNVIFNPLIGKLIPEDFGPDVERIKRALNRFSVSLDDAINLGSDNNLKVQIFQNAYGRFMPE